MLKIIITSYLLIGNFVAQDTLLEAFYNERIYYNLAVDMNGDVLISSDDGVFKFLDSQLKRVNKNPGYIDFRDGSIIHSKYSEVEKDYNHGHLLPDYYKNFGHYSEERNNQIYLVSNNNLFIFKVSEYKTYLPQSSIRAFSPNSVGTYDGIYCYGDKIREPTYTSGHIREIDSTFYICYDGLATYNRNEGVKLFKRDLTNEAKFGSKSVGFARDIYKLNNGSFLLATTKGLYILNSTFTTAEALYEEVSLHGAEIIFVLQETETLAVTFSINNSLYEYSLLDKELRQLASFDQTIEDGLRTDQKSKKHYILLTDDKLFALKDQYKELIVDNKFSNAYSLLPFDDNKVIVTSLSGAFAVNLSTKKTTKILDGIEFNKRAVFRTKDSVKLGTVNGYFSLSIDRLNNMIEKEDNLIEIKRKELLYTIIISMLSIVSVFLALYFLISSRRKRANIQNIGLQEIEGYIESNLNQVTIDNIANQFDLNLKELYELVHPDKPGKLITLKRKEKAKLLLEQQADLQTISQETGFSVSYLKRIKGFLIRAS